MAQAPNIMHGLCRGRVPAMSDRQNRALGLMYGTAGFPLQWAARPQNEDRSLHLLPRPPADFMGNFLFLKIKQSLPYQREAFKIFFEFPSSLAKDGVRQCLPFASALPLWRSRGAQPRRRHQYRRQPDPGT